MPSTWLVVVAWIALAVALVSAVVILADIYVRGYRLKMAVMEAVWPVTALYFGPVAVWGYWRFGRTTSSRWLVEHGRSEPPDKPGWATIATGVSHCGARWRRAQAVLSRWVDPDVRAVGHLDHRRPPPRDHPRPRRQHHRPRADVIPRTH
jgi:hypothetical protein